MRALLLASLLLLTACEAPPPQVALFDRDHLPEKLSAWGVLAAGGGELRLHDAAIPYDLNSPLFTDYAQKLRTLWIPPGRTATVADDGRLLLPVGSILTKTFYYPVEQPAGETWRLQKVGGDAFTTDAFTPDGLRLDRVRLVETRLLVHMEEGWVGLPYVWDEDQRDATLRLGGDMRTLTLDGEAFTYVVPDFNQCQGCHIDDLTTDAMQPIGLKVRHLNKAYGPLRPTDDQLARLTGRGLLEPAAPSETLAANADWTDVSAPLDQRARSYLDINCGHCHNARGAADTSGLFLDIHEQRPLQLGLCKPPIAAGQGTGGRRVNIEPGSADGSILVYRMASTDPGAMMPELGRSLVHEEGVALISSWIEAMPGDC